MSPPPCEEDILLNYLTLNIKEIITIDKNGNFPGAIIQPDENIDIALFPIGETITIKRNAPNEFKDEQIRTISTKDLALPIHVTASPLIGKVLIFQFPGPKWFERPTTLPGKRQNMEILFNLGFSIGDIVSTNNKKGMYHIYHTASTIEGSSGSPLIQFIGNKPYLIAIHTLGFDKGIEANRAKKLNEINEYIKVSTSEMSQNEENMSTLKNGADLPKIFYELQQMQITRTESGASEIDDICLGFNLMDLSENSSEFIQNPFDIRAKSLSSPSETEIFYNNIKFPIFPYEIYEYNIDSIFVIEHEDKKIGIGCFCKIFDKVGLLIQDNIDIDVKQDKNKVLENSLLVYHLLSAKPSKTNYKYFINGNEKSEEIIILEDTLKFIVVPTKIFSELALPCLEIRNDLPSKAITIVVSFAENSIGFQTVIIKDFFRVVNTNNYTICVKISFVESKINFNKNILSLLFQLDSTNKTFNIVGLIKIRNNSEDPQAYCLQLTKH